MISPRDDSLAWINAHCFPAPDLYLAGVRAAWLAHIRDAAQVHLHLAARFPCLGVPCGELGRTFDDVARHSIDVFRHANDDVTARVSSGM